MPKLWVGREYMRYCLWEVEPTYFGDQHGFNTPPKNEQLGRVADVHVSQFERLFGFRLELGELVQRDVELSEVLECSESASGSGR